MEIRVLGPLVVVEGEHVIPVAGRRERAILAMLAVHLDCTVSTESLIGLLWGDRPPGDPANALRTHMSRLRGSLRSAPVTQVSVEAMGHGFRLTGDGLIVDCQQAEVLATCARHAAAAGDWDVARESYAAAVALWRGDPLAELGEHPSVVADVVRFRELREELLEERIDTELATGHHHEVVAELEAMVADRPLRERRWGQLMVALYRSCRQAESLRAFQRLRRTLADELGVSPTAALIALEDAVIHQTSELDWCPATTDRSGPAPHVAQLSDRDEASPPPVRVLPEPMGAFVGRLEERGAVRELLAAHRLVSLTGTGGCGKTRLALAVATEVSTVGWGARYIDLESVEDPRYVAAGFAEGLWMPDPHRATVETVTRFAARGLGAQPVLVVVDNCEHLIDAVADLVWRLLKVCPALRVLGTSREPLGLPGETVWRVPPLRVPPEPGAPVRREDLMCSDSVQLFVNRVDWPDVALDDGAVESVARMCRIVDGLPLAIEIAAGLANTLPLDEVELRLRQHVSVGDTGRRTVSRHRSLAAAMRWSFDSLDPAERLLQIGLSTFVGPFNVADARGVGEAFGVADPALVLSRLVRKSLVSPEFGPGGVERYRLLSTIRLLTVDELATVEEVARARRAHAGYYCGVAEEADRDVHGPRAGERLRQVAAALPELRAALRYSIAASEIDTGARLAGALRWFFGRLCIWEEVRDWLGQLLARRSELWDRERLRLLTASMSFAFSAGDFTGIWELSEEAIAVAGQLGDRTELAVTLTFGGVTAVYTGRFPAAMAAFAQAETLWRQLDDRFGLGWALTERAVVLRRIGELDVADRDLESAIALFTRLGDRHSLIMPTLHRGLVAHQAGLLTDAAEYCKAAVDLAVEISDRQYLHLGLCCSARVAIDQGETVAARAMLASALVDYSDAQNRIVVAIGVEGLAIVAGLSGAAREMVMLWGFADELRAASSLPLTSQRLAERDRWLSSARLSDGDTAVDAAWAAGRAMTHDEAVGLGLAVTGESTAGSGDVSGRRGARPTGSPAGDDGGTHVRV